MVELQIHKKDTAIQLWPISFNGVLIFNDSFFGEKGFFGIKDNYLVFIKDEDIPEEFTIQIPENLEEVQGFLGSAEYLLHRAMVTPEIAVVGFTNLDLLNNDDIKSEIIKIFSDFINIYNRNVNKYELIKNNW